MGVGIDISQQHKLKQKLSKSEKEKQKALEELHKKERELVISALQLSENNVILNQLNKKVKILLNKDERTITKKQLKDLQNSLESKFSDKDNWELFKTRFSQIHNNYFTNLLEAHPALTKTEIKLSAFLKINMSSDQISSILNVSKEGIKKSRYRISKKIGLKHSDSLENYISNF